MNLVKPGWKSFVGLALLFGGFSTSSVQADEADQHKELGNVYYNAGRYDDALKEYRTAIRLRPHFPKAYNNIGSVYVDEGKAQLAIVPLLTAIKLDPKYAHAYYNLGKAYADSGKSGQAINAYTKAAALDPTDPDTPHNLGNVYARAKHWKQAISFYQQALHLGPPSPELQADLAAAYVSTDQDDQAFSLYNQLFAVKRTAPEYAMSYYDFGCALSNKGRHEDAITAFLQSIALRSDNTYPRVALGGEYIATKQWDQAVETLRDAVRLSPTLPLAHLNLGVALSGQGHEPEARVEWQTVLTLDHGAIAEIAKGRLAGSAAAK